MIKYPHFIITFLRSFTTMNNLSHIAKKQFNLSAEHKARLREQHSYKYLNNGQFEAVTYPLSSFLVLAGAGTGKTSVLINRIRYAIEELKVEPKRILAVTFTNKAAKEIRSRLFSAFKTEPHKAQDPNIGTFHSVCLRLIRENASYLGLNSNYSLWDEDDISNHLVEFLHEGYDRPLALMTEDELEFRKSTPFLSPHQQIEILKAGVESAKKKCSQDFNALNDRNTDNDDIYNELERLNDYMNDLCNISEYLEFLFDATLGKKTTVLDGGKSRLNIGDYLHQEISTFKESGWRSNEANEVNAKYFEADYLPDVGHYIPRFMRDKFHLPSALRYLALVVYRDYETYSKDMHLLDFSDLLLLSVELLEQNKIVRDRISGSYDMIMVDEFQDTNMLQYRWLKLMTNEKTSVMVVGDDDQSIYGWRGAHPEYMEYFLYDFQHPLPEYTANVNSETFEARRREVGPLEVVRLEQNYRCSKNVLEAANRIIERNYHRLGKTLFTKRETDNDEIDLIKFDKEYDEAEWIAHDIKKRIHESVLKNKEDPDSPILTYEDFAILYRNNRISYILDSVFVQQSIPHVIFGGFNFYQRKEVKEGLSWLNFIMDSDNDLLFEKTFKQIAPTKRYNPFAETEKDRMKGFSPKLIDTLNAERKRSNVARLVEALINLSLRYECEKAVLNNDMLLMQELGIDTNWVSPYAIMRGGVMSEFHHDVRYLKEIKSVYQYSQYLNECIMVMNNNKLSLKEAVEAIWDKCGYWSYYQMQAEAERDKEKAEQHAQNGKTTNKQKKADAEKAFEHVQDLLTQIGEWENNQIEYDEDYFNKPLYFRLSEYLHDVMLYTDKENTKQSTNLVRMMTVHSAKGLEFNHVYIAGVSSGIFPSSRGDEEEETRLMYVAITRARKRLTVSSVGEKSMFMDFLEKQCFSVTNDLGLYSDKDIKSILRHNDYQVPDVYGSNGSVTGVDVLQKVSAKQRLKHLPNYKDKDAKKDNAPKLFERKKSEQKSQFELW